MTKPRIETDLPDRAALLQMLWTMPLTRVGRKLGMSERAVRKMVRALGLPIACRGSRQNKSHAKRHL
jgi:ethanolamine transporter EutH